MSTTAFLADIAPHLGPKRMVVKIGELFEETLDAMMPSMEEVAAALEQEHRLWQAVFGKRRVTFCYPRRKRRVRT